MFLHFRVLNLDWLCSDHRPIGLRLVQDSPSGRQSRRCLSFKFNAQWVRHDECRSIICEVGEWFGRNASVESLQNSLSQCPRKLKVWGRDANVHLMTEIHKQKQAIQSAYRGYTTFRFFSYSQNGGWSCEAVGGGGD